MEIDLKKFNEVIEAQVIEFQNHVHDNDDCTFCNLYYGIGKNQHIVNYCCRAFSDAIDHFDPTYFLGAYVFGFMAAKKYFEMLELEALYAKLQD